MQLKLFNLKVLYLLSYFNKSKQLRFPQFSFAEALQHFPSMLDLSYEFLVDYELGFNLF